MYARRNVVGVVTAVALLILVVNSGGHGAVVNNPPIAEAGLPRYAGQDPVQLDGRGSYDPDHSGPLRYAWKQVSGPPLLIAGADTATPTISGFVQTKAIQECRFELIVNDGDMASSPALARVLVVPGYGGDAAQLFNKEFDARKPTIVYFGGGDCTVGYTGYQYGARLPFQSAGWLSKANILWFPNSYSPDDGPERTYYRYGDMLIVYLSRWRRPTISRSRLPAGARGASRPSTLAFA